MPSHELDNDAWLAEQAESRGYTAQRAYTPTTPAAASAPAPAADPLELLRLSVRGFAPVACLQAYVLIVEDGVHPALRTYHLKLSGTEVREAVKTQGTSVEAVLVEAKKAWAKERRKTEVFRLVEDCQRIVQGSLDEDFESALTYEMQACPVSSFATLADKWRSKARGYAKQLDQAA